MNRSNVCLLVSTVLVIAGCGSQPDEPAVTDPATPPGTRPPATAPAAPALDLSGTVGGASNDGTYHVAYRPNPDPIPLGEPFDLEVWVLDGAGVSTLQSDVRLDVDARMPHHRHGMNQVPEVTAHDDGRFTVTGMLCHMPGYWELYFDVTRDGITERAQFAIDLE